MSELVQIAGSFADRVNRLLERLTYVRARTDADLEPIYHLRYEANLREGTLNPLDSKRLIDGYDATPNVYNFGINIDGVLISALRLHILSRVNPISIACELYSDILAEKIENGHIIVDGDRFVADYPRARRYPQLPYVTLRLGLMAAEYFGGDYITASVRLEHVPFYQREYFADKLSEPRAQPQLVKHYCLVSIDYRRYRDAIIERHGFYASTAEEREALFGQSDSQLASPIEEFQRGGRALGTG